MSKWLLTAILVLVPTTASFGFVRGDANDDGSIDIGDAVSILAVLFNPGTDPLECPDVGDVNDDGAFDISDAIYLLSTLFLPGSPAPLPPFPDDGNDPTPDSLTPDCAPVGPTGPRGFFNIDQGGDSGAAPGEYLIFDQATWEDFWIDHAGGTAPFVDFSLDAVVAVVRSYPNLEHCIDIVSLNDNGVSTDIGVRHYEEQLPCAFFLLPTTPYHIVRWENASMVIPFTAVSEQLVGVCPLPCP
ncbi:MAG: dockerin type I repeat-containing protein [Planctomycetota bacterium]